MIHNIQHFPSLALTRSGYKNPEVSLRSQPVSQAPLVYMLLFYSLFIVARIDEMSNRVSVFHPIIAPLQFYAKRVFVSVASKVSEKFSRILTISILSSTLSSISLFLFHIYHPILYTIVYFAVSASYFTAPPHGYA